MVPVRAAMLASAMLLVGATLSGTSAQDSQSYMVRDDTGGRKSSDTPNWESDIDGDDNGGGGGKEGFSDLETRAASTGGRGSKPSTGGGKVPDGTWPKSTGLVRLKAPQVIKAGEDFDGKMRTFERSDITCQGQNERMSDTAVFLVEAGGTLRNAIIGKDQMEGVHCDEHDCVIDNVWWDDVCEDALTIQNGTASSVSTVIGGGARLAEDKVVQHNGVGTVKIDGFYGEDIGKLYRSCGNCGNRMRKVEVSNVYVVDLRKALVTVNENYKDEATLSNIWVTSNKKKVKICQWSQGTTAGREPKMLGDGPSPPLCQYTKSDVHINKGAPSGGSSEPRKGSSPFAFLGGDSVEQEAGVVSPGGGDDGTNGGEDEAADEGGDVVDQRYSNDRYGGDDKNGGKDDHGGGDNGGGNGKEGFSDLETRAASTGGRGSKPSIGGGKVPDGTWPKSTGLVRLKAPQVIKAGEDFDGKMRTFERSDITCQGQNERMSDTAVFLVEAGGTLRNAIIGKDQMEGVHCDEHDCVIDNVWWDDVCEDALTIQNGTASSVSTVIGGGARLAEDKVVQHNGVGTVKIDGFYGEDIGKLYRSCGNCGNRMRKVEVSNVYVVDLRKALVTVNENYKDEATLSNIWVTSNKKKVKICQWSQGTTAGREPKMLGDGPSPPLCQYTKSDVHINKGAPSETGTDDKSGGHGGVNKSKGGDDDGNEKEGGGTKNEDKEDDEDGKKDKKESEEEVAASKYSIRRRRN
ncbi:unnamed protein product [Hyaloperonospora brassicae]|uniref:Probable pectate lyase F n=1 Tax=Hyaloperonospora brassicae TaxID=162125 RepID=A0AAV0TM16_HYABA|nr:unnamed protein product [Hyaloperonospora brassicae]